MTTMKKVMEKTRWFAFALATVVALDGHAGTETGNGKTANGTETGNGKTANGTETGNGKTANGTETGNGNKLVRAGSGSGAFVPRSAGCAAPSSPLAIAELCVVELAAAARD
jgi:hypothetical protein